MMHASRIAMVPAHEHRPTSQFTVLAGLSGWLVYTFFFQPLQAAHLTIPSCPFLTLTGHPCPFCGGTRSFAATWHGDLGQALHLYPLGPLLFVASVLAVLVLVALVLTRRQVRVTLTRQQQMTVLAAVATVLLVQWAAKLLWLGN